MFMHYFLCLWRLSLSVYYNSLSPWRIQGKGPKKSIFSNMVAARLWTWKKCNVWQWVDVWRQVSAVWKVHHGKDENLAESQQGFYHRHIGWQIAADQETWFTFVAAATFLLCSCNQTADNKHPEALCSDVPDSQRWVEARRPGMESVSASRRVIAASSAGWMPASFRPPDSDKSSPNLLSLQSQTLSPASCEAAGWVRTRVWPRWPAEASADAGSPVWKLSEPMVDIVFVELALKDWNEAKAFGVQDQD